MKRYISLACIALVIVTCMVSPVSAASFDSYFFNVLDHSFPNDSYGRIVWLTANDNRVTFTLPEEIPLYYIDMLLTITGNVPSSVICSNKFFTDTLNIEYINGNSYRVYGNLSGKSSSIFYLDFSGITSNSYITFQSVNVATSALSLDPVPLEGVGTYPGGTFDMSKNFGDDRPTRTIISNSDFDDRDFILYLYSSDWRKYDYLEFQCYFIIETITSISCVMGQENVPFEVSYITDTNSDSNFYVTLRIDCRNLDRTSDDYPMIIINGNVIFDGSSLVSLMNSNGVLCINDVSPLTYYFKSLFKNIDSNFENLISSLSSNFISLFNNIDSNFESLISTLSSNFISLGNWLSAQTDSINSTINTLNADLYYWLYYGLQNWILNQTDRLESAIRGDTSPGNSFQQQVSQKDQQLNDMAAVMDSVNQPDLNTVNVSANSYVDSTVLAASMSGITSVFSQGLYFDIIVMSIMMATAGYVLFGKR